MQEFAGRVAVITGAASGIGFALARKFGEEGMKVVLADVEAGALQNAAQELEKKGLETLAVLTDVTRAEDVRALAEKTLDRFGAVHVVCNNAGVFGGGGESWEASIQDYEWILGVNLWGVVHGIRTFVPILLEQDCEGHVVNTASMAAVTSVPYSAIYYMSKHAVLSLSESLYHELTLRPSKIGVSVLCPEQVATHIDRAERNRPDHLKAGSGAPNPHREMVKEAIAQAVQHGTPPEAVAERTLRAIRENRFYVLSNDAWARACETRMEDIRLRRNPTFAPPLPTDPSGS
jgi:NAD(P)-dependent dehydrogenase (short-subunit alcohol dehydrogenase family)